MFEPPPDSPGGRFRAFREKAGLTHDEVAIQLGFENGVQKGIGQAAIWDIELCKGDLEQCYSPHELRRMGQILDVHPCAIFGLEISASPISPNELVRLIHEQCRLRGITLLEFEDVVGWRLSAWMEPPEQLLKEMTIDGMQWLCRELDIDWARVISGL